MDGWERRIWSRCRVYGTVCAFTRVHRTVKVNSILFSRSLAWRTAVRWWSLVVLMLRQRRRRKPKGNGCWLSLSLLDVHRSTKGWMSVLWVPIATDWENDSIYRLTQFPFQLLVNQMRCSCPRMISKWNEPICIGKIRRRHCCYFCFLSTRAEQILVRKLRRFLRYCPILIDLNLSQYLSSERGDTIGEVSLADNRNHRVFVYQVNVFAGDCVIAHANVHGEMKTNVQPPPPAPRGALTIALSIWHQRENMI